MYRRPKFLEVLIEIREQMAREADFDMNRFVELIRNGEFSTDVKNSTLGLEKETEKSSQNEEFKFENLENTKI